MTKKLEKINSCLSPNKPIVLIGLPGCGKSSAGPKLAKLLGRDFLDTDDIIENELACSVADIFSSVGESGFRIIEAHVVAKCLDTPNVVVALGGGAPTFALSRKLLQNAEVIYLHADVKLALKRMGDATQKRPLLAKHPKKSLRRLYKKRDGLYRQVATIFVDAQFKAKDSAKLMFQALVKQDSVHSSTSTDQAIKVTGETDYSVLIETGMLEQINAFIPCEVNKVMIIHSSPLTDRAHHLSGIITSANRECFLVEIPDREAGKELPVFEYCLDRSEEFQLSRRDLIISLGGGAVTDLSGFVASTWLRGINVLHVPTSLLAMVDAAVGGKTGINWKHGKNLVGTFHAPIGVLCDLDALETLPHEFLVEGMAEIIKCGFLAPTHILDLLDKFGEKILDPKNPALKTCIRDAVEVKARIVSQDFTEQGNREFLNFGHTLAHGIEKGESYAWSHGHSVAVGMVFAGHLSEILGLCHPGLACKIMNYLSLVGLPIKYEGLCLHKLLELMRLDKKVRNGALRFVLLKDLGDPVTVKIDSNTQLLQAAKRSGLKICDQCLLLA